MDPPQEFENSKPPSKETPILPSFGKNSQKPDKPSGYKPALFFFKFHSELKNVPGNLRKNNNINDNDLNFPPNQTMPHPITSNKV